MALHSVRFFVYVALAFVFRASNKFTSANPGVGGSGAQSLLQPYDFIYYSGVRAYFGEEWTKAVELLEKSIVTKESLIRVRKKCYDECVAAGRQALDKLGKFKHPKSGLVPAQSNPAASHHVVADHSYSSLACLRINVGNGTVENCNTLKKCWVFPQENEETCYCTTVLNDFEIKSVPFKTLNCALTLTDSFLPYIFF